MHRIRKLVGDVVADTAPPAVVSHRASVAEVAQAMRTSARHAALVTNDEGVLVGIFTERDLLNRVAAPGSNLTKVPVLEVMTPEPVALREDACITYAINRMGLERFSNVPLVDADRRPLGLIGVKDVMRHLHDVFADLQAAPVLNDHESPWLDIGGSG